MTTAAVEEYLAVAFRLQEEEAPVTVAALAQRLSLSHASVSLMVKRLVQEELLERQNGELRLSAEGERRAAEVVRRHRLAERFLFDVLGLAWDDVHDEAGRWEPVLSPAGGASLGLLPGARVLVEQVAPFGGPLLVRLGSARYALGRDMAGQILVRKGAR